jgi:asparagine synthase (glutamine-hydrolysing)
MVAETFGTDHREFEVGPECLDALPDLIKHYGQPFADSSALPTYYLSKHTREHVTVALCGDGGDEAFGGYDRYFAMRLGAVYNTVPRLLRNAISGTANALLPAKTEPRTLSGRIKRFLDVCRLDGIDRYLAIIQHLSDEDRKSLVPGFAGNEQSSLPLSLDFQMATSGNLVEKIMEVDLLNYLPDDLLVKVDIASMAHSLEVRSPFLDHRVVEFAASLPIKWKLGPGIRGNSKHILKTAFQDMLPADILTRKKMGFGIPLVPWLRNEWAGYARETLLSREAVDRRIFDAEAVGRLLDEHIEGRADNAYKIWNLMCFELWMKGSTE